MKVAVPTRQDPRAVGRNKHGSVVSICDGLIRHAGSQALLNGIVSIPPFRRPPPPALRGCFPTF